MKQVFQSSCELPAPTPMSWLKPNAVLFLSLNEDEKQEHTKQPKGQERKITKLSFRFFSYFPRVSKGCCSLFAGMFEHGLIAKNKAFYGRLVSFD